MKKKYTTDELIFAPDDEVYSWVGHNVELILKDKTTVNDVIAKIVIDDDSWRTIIQPQFRPLAIKLAAIEKEIQLDSIKTMKIKDL